jgi:hypothetical protein
MDTIRCPRCNKLLRIDAQTCNRCGIAIIERKNTRKRDSDEQTFLSSQPSNPPASPHRAGHYSGLHAEDQPFQSSFFQSVKRPVEPEPANALDASPLLNGEEDDPAISPPASLWSGPLHRHEEPEEDMTVAETLADFPTRYPRQAPITPLPAILEPAPPVRVAKKSLQPVPLLITASLICFLAASSLLAFLLLGKSQVHAVEPQLLALPGELRVEDTLQLSGSGFAARHILTLSRDAHTLLQDAQGQHLRPVTSKEGTFSIALPVTALWSIGVHRLQASTDNLVATTSVTIAPAATGPPLLQLGSSHIDMGASNAGTMTQKNMTLTNTGGGQVHWSAQSSVPWLSLQPVSGVFVGNAAVSLTANRTNLPPQAYLGQVIFTQAGGGSQILHVSMIVNTMPADLMLSTASLAFTGTPTQSPAGQTIVLQNSGGQTLDWTGASTTADGASWLSVTPASGILGPGTSAILTVVVNTAGMTLGSYQGALSFSYAGGPSQQVAITLVVNPPPQPIMHTAPASLNFSSQQGVNPVPQHLTLSNSGNAPLNWAISADANGMSYLTISPLQGSIPPGQSENVSIAPQLGSASGTIHSMLTVVDSDAGTSVVRQFVAVTLAITSEPILTLVTGNQEFDHPGTPTATSELLIFSNAGSLPLHWALTTSPQVGWISFDVTSGIVASNELGFITVTCTSNAMKVGTYKVVVTLRDTDVGTVVAPQTITVTLVIASS